MNTLNYTVYTKQTGLIPCLRQIYARLERGDVFINPSSFLKQWKQSPTLFRTLEELKVISTIPGPVKGNYKWVKYFKPECRDDFMKDLSLEVLSKEKEGRKKNRMLKAPKQMKTRVQKEESFQTLLKQEKYENFINLLYDKVTKGKQIENRLCKESGVDLGSIKILRDLKAIKCIDSNYYSWGQIYKNQEDKVSGLREIARSLEETLSLKKREYFRKKNWTQGSTITKTIDFKSEEPKLTRPEVKEVVSSREEERQLSNSTDTITIPREHIAYLIPGYKNRIQEIEMILNPLLEERDSLRAIVLSFEEVNTLNNTQSLSNQEELVYSKDLPLTSKVKYVLFLKKKKLTTGEIARELKKLEPKLSEVNPSLFSTSISESLIRLRKKGNVERYKIGVGNNYFYELKEI